MKKTLNALALTLVLSIGISNTAFGVWPFAKPQLTTIQKAVNLGKQASQYAWNTSIYTKLAAGLVAAVATGLGIYAVAKKPAKVETSDEKAAPVVETPAEEKKEETKKETDNRWFLQRWLAQAVNIFTKKAAPKVETPEEKTKEKKEEKTKEKKEEKKAEQIGNGSEKSKPECKDGSCKLNPSTGQTTCTTGNCKSGNCGKKSENNQTPVANSNFGRNGQKL